MADKKQCDQYATEMARRFEDFTKWAVDNWPHRAAPLLSSDFEASRKEVGAILGARLSAGRDTPSSAAQEQEYVQLKPAPWP